jgi:hypothetical protein
MFSITIITMTKFVLNRNASKGNPSENENFLPPRQLGRKKCKCNPSNLGIKLNEALENMMQKGPMAGGS